MDNRTIEFNLTHQTTQAPLSDQVLTFALYVGPDGNPRTSPAIVSLGNGKYSFTVTEEDYQLGVAYEFSCGANAVPTRASGSLGPLIAFAFYDMNTGLPVSSGIPTLMSYQRADGQQTTPPTLLSLGGGLFGFLVPLVERRSGVGYLVRAPEGALPEYFSGTEGFGFDIESNSPTITNMLPVPGEPLSANQSITFDVQDAETSLGRVMIVVQYGSNNLTEVAWDGDRANGAYRVTSIPILNGCQYTVRRNGGWRGPFTLRVFAHDLVGNEI